MIMRGADERMADIFGTPPEPIFNLKGSCLPSELLEELLYVQAAQNDKSARAASVTDGVFKQGRIAEVIFLTCDKLRQPPESRYLAVEIFNRFLTKFAQEQHQRVRTGKASGQKKDAAWETFRHKLLKNLKLYMVSCVQIASKMCSHYKILTCRKCCRFLREAGQACTPATILRTELSVLKTCDYHVYVPSPLTYVETLLEIMGHNDSSASVKVLHEMSLKVMDLAYLRRGALYRSLFEVAGGSRHATQEEREKFAVVEHDMMLLAAAVIGAASYVTDKTTSNMVVEHMSRIIVIPAPDITEFGALLIENVL